MLSTWPLSVVGVLGIQTQDHWMVGADESTELWRPHDDGNSIQCVIVTHRYMYLGTCNNTFSSSMLSTERHRIDSILEERIAEAGNLHASLDGRLQRSLVKPLVNKSSRANWSVSIAKREDSRGDCVG